MSETVTPEVRDFMQMWAWLSALIVYLLAIFVPIASWVFCMLPFWRSPVIAAPKADDASNAAAAATSAAVAPPSEVPSDEGVTLTFVDVAYSVPRPGKPELVILRGVSGVLPAGSLTAVMGPSGCGKSTLLDILADCKTSGVISADIRINGQPRPSNFRSVAGYVMQDDNTHTTLTVRETLYFAAQLRLPGSVSAEERAAVVEQTLKDTDLLHVADTRIGDDVSGGLSGGQRRRATVAIELINQPRLLFLDEPTSGLDAFGALQVTTALKRFADRGQTVACTIHQPRSDIFALFDQLLLMSSGEIMYFGPVTDIYPYFESVGVSCDTSVNPADFIVDLTHSHEKELDAVEEDEDDDDDEDDDTARDSMLAFVAPPASRVGLSTPPASPPEPDAQAGALTTASKAVASSHGEGSAGVEPSGTSGYSAAWKPAPPPGPPPTQASSANLLGGQARRKTKAAPPTVDELVVLYQFSALHHLMAERTSAAASATYAISGGRYAVASKRASNSAADSGGAAAVEEKYANPLARQVRVLAWRMFVLDLRNPAYVASWIVNGVVLMLQGLTYVIIVQPPSNVPSNYLSYLRSNFEQYGVCDLDPSVTTHSDVTACGEGLLAFSAVDLAHKALLFMVLNALFVNELAYVPMVHAEKIIFHREHGANAYSSAAWHLTWLLKCTVSASIKMLVYPPLYYFLSKLVLEPLPYFIAALCSGAMGFAGSATAILCAAAIPSYGSATSIFTIAALVFQNFAGFYLPLTVVPEWLRWIKWFSVYFYAYDAFTVTQLRSDNFGRYHLSRSVSSVGWSDVFDPVVRGLLTYAWAFVYHALALAATTYYSAGRATYIDAAKKPEDSGRHGLNARASSPANSVRQSAYALEAQRAPSVAIEPAVALTPVAEEASSVRLDPNAVEVVAPDERGFAGGATAEAAAAAAATAAVAAAIAAAMAAVEEAAGTEAEVQAMPEEPALTGKHHWKRLATTVSAARGFDRKLLFAASIASTQHITLASLRTASGTSGELGDETSAPLVQPGTGCASAGADSLPSSSFSPKRRLSNLVREAPWKLKTAILAAMEDAKLAHESNMRDGADATARTRINRTTDTYRFA